MFNGLTNVQINDLNDKKTIVVQITNKDLNLTNEVYEKNKTDLIDGLEFPVTPLSEKNYANIIYLGDPWTRVITQIYRNNGKIIYKTINGINIEAVITIK